MLASYTDYPDGEQSLDQSGQDDNSAEDAEPAPARQTQMPLETTVDICLKIPAGHGHYI
jgi:hypothetical protein